jgi:transposase
MEEQPVKGKASRQGRGGKSPSLLERINPNAAGIDCGSAEHYVAVPADRDPQPVRHFKTFTEDLHRLADWLVSCGIQTVAMEATGVYWIPIFEILEARGLEVLLVNARHVRNVPGRKSDVTDCEWLQQLHSVGLLRGSFRPAAEIAALRSYLRHRESLVQGAASSINRMQKALVQMNLQLHVVISNLASVTGLRIIRDIVSGQTDPRRLAKHRDTRCNASEEQIASALTGHYRAEHLFALKQNLELFDALQRQIEECDVQIESCLTELARRAAPAAAPLPAGRSRRRPRGNEPNFDLRTPLHCLTGTDLSQLDGIGPYNALRLLSEIGTDMSRWPSERHFTSWLTLAPNNKISGGRLLSSRTQPSAHRAAAILRMAAMSLGRTQTALGAFYRRLAFRIGKAKAITATARKLAILVYRSLKGEIVYKDPGAAEYDLRHRRSVIRRIRQRAEALGFDLVNRDTGEVLDGVS